MLSSKLAIIWISELQLKPGDKLNYRIEARDLLNQWGHNPFFQIQIPIASGDRSALETAQKVRQIYRGLSQTCKSFAKVYLSFSDIFKKLKGRPPKWNSSMEMAYSPLRTSMETFIQNISNVYGQAMRIKIEGGDGARLFHLATKGAMDAWRAVDQVLWRTQQARSETSVP